MKIPYFKSDKKLLKSKHTADKLVLLFVSAIVLFNFPILSIFNVNALTMGIPILYVYLFSIWAGIIILLFFILHKTDKREDNEIDEK